MNRFPSLLSALGLLGVLAACGGQEAPADDPQTQAAPEAAAEPAASAGGLSCYLAGATPEEARQRVSPHSSLSWTMGSVRALLCYGAPSVRGREIFGGLEPYGQPWRMGADEPTTLHLSGRANVGGIALEPGSYSIYGVPGEDEWEIFINSNWQRWGIPIDQGVRATEIGSFTVTPQELPETVEQLRYEWEDAAGGEPGGELFMEWANTLIAIPIEA